MIRNRTMRRADLDLALDWAAEQGWNPGLDDADAFWVADPGGFFVAEEGGAPVAAISVVNHSDAFAFLGLYLCLPSHRGRGIGLGLWQHALAHAGGRTIGLDGVEAQQANYEASGFRRAGETVRYVGRLAEMLPPADLRAANADDASALVDLERAASGWAKPRYLTAWFGETSHRTTLLLESAGRIAGAVTVRRCRSGAKVGPLMAPDEATAMSLLGAAQDWAGSEITIDVPDGAAAFGATLARQELVPGFQTARMYRGAVPSPAPADVGLYAVSSLELG